MKKITVNEKLFGKISIILTMKLGLHDLIEFEELENQKLFEDRPEFWSKTEDAICEYTQRVHTEIMDEIKELLINGNAR